MNVNNREKNSDTNNIQKKTELICSYTIYKYTFLCGKQGLG